MNSPEALIEIKNKTNYVKFGAQNFQWNSLVEISMQTLDAYTNTNKKILL